ncbi:TPA: hypothetical protein ACH3X1_011779 [Trebouxia sp. C0004]
MAALAFTETGMQKLSQLYDSAATPNQPVHPFLGDEDILTLALRDTAASEPAIRKGLHVLQTIPSVLKDVQLLAKMRQLILSSHDESRLKPHEPSLPNAHSKQHRKGRQGKKQPDAAGSKQKPTRKAQRQSQRLKEKPEPPKRQKQNNNRTRVADESQSDGLGMLVAAAELDDEAEISSTTSSDADRDEEPQELYDSGSGRD